ncbi:conserved Plasmodium protein, unknown function [Plasmodium ovale]|uniref:PH domain-containing protein n=1 Tax=Plasmodium ovale TaxID=36330 RepID=A0A1D3TIL3_PLAOA|nr:conserved Plasmodium protein, unknown function [Plasmodium ovale]
MKLLLRFSLSALLIMTYAFCAAQNDTNFCAKTHRGILRYHQKKEKKEYIPVSAVLKRDALDMYKGSKLFYSINLAEVIPPLEIFSTSPECLTVNIINKDSIVLCCNTEECINNWWVFLTKQILCLNQGEMRDETDDNTVEDRQYNIINNDNFDGVSVDIQDRLEDIPNG